MKDLKPTQKLNRKVNVFFSTKTKSGKRKIAIKPENSLKLNKS